MYLSEHAQEKWGAVINHPELPEIKDSYKRAVTAVLLENQEKALAEERAAICGECPHRNNSWYVQDNKDIWTCGLCGCPLSKKIFSPAGPDACPDKRWKQ